MNLLLKKPYKKHYFMKDKTNFKRSAHKQKLKEVRISRLEKQRLSIARALLKNSPIILLDEATSSLDAESENQVQQAISNLTKNKTTIIIAHRLSTIMNADTIFVLSNGEIVASGKHKELLNTSKIYKNLYDKQLEAVWCSYCTTYLLIYFAYFQKFTLK